MTENKLSFFILLSSLDLNRSGHDARMHYNRKLEKNLGMFSWENFIILSSQTLKLIRIKELSKELEKYFGSFSLEWSTMKTFEQDFLENSYWRLQSENIEIWEWFSGFGRFGKIKTLIKLLKMNLSVSKINWWTLRHWKIYFGKLEKLANNLKIIDISRKRCPFF